MYMSDYYEEGVLRAIYGTSFTAPSKLYVALSSTDPSESGSAIIEPNYTGYARKEFIPTSPALINNNMGFSNSSEIKFAISDVDSATITHIAIFDSITGGNMFMYGKLNTEKQIKIGTEPTLRVGEAQFWITGNLSKAFAEKVLRVCLGTTLAGMSVYITLYNNSPESGGVELSGGNFARQLVAYSLPVEQTNGQRIITNPNTVTFPIATVDLGNYNTEAFFDAASGGGLIYYTVGVSDTYTNGDSIKYAPNQIQLALS